MGNKELVTQTANLAPSIFQPEDDVILSQDVSAADIRISRVLLAHKMSPITDKPGTTIQAGDLYDSVTEERLLAKGAVLEIIPFYLFKTLTVKWEVNGKFEFKEAMPWKPEFAKLPWEFEKGGVKHKNIEGINLLCMRAADMGNPNALPFLVTFRITSLNCGKDIVADYVKATNAKANFAQAKIGLYTELVTKDNNAYYVFKKKVATGNPDYAANKDTFKFWTEQFSKGLAKVDSEQSLEDTEKDVSNGVPF